MKRSLSALRYLGVPSNVFLSNIVNVGSAQIAEGPASTFNGQSDIGVSCQ
jgi:hypothetical protein